MRLELSRFMARGLSSNQATLLWTLAVAAEKNMPLIEEIDALADDNRGRQRRRLRDLSDMLRAGVTLPDALEGIPGILPRQTVFAVRVGFETGAMAAALRTAAVDLSTRIEDENFFSFAYLAYAVILVFFMFGIVSFMLYYILPKFQVIFSDFNVDLPASTVLVLQVADVFTQYFFLFVPGTLVLIALIVALFLWGILGGMTILEIPGFLLRMIPRLESASILRNLALAVEMNSPLNDALGMVAAWHPRAQLRRRLSAVELSVEQGDDCFNSLRRHRLVTRAECRILQAAQRAGNLAWALRVIAERVERRLRGRFQIFGEFVQPLLVILLGVVVFAICFAFFSPLVKLLNELVDQDLVI